MQPRELRPKTFLKFQAYLYNRLGIRFTPEKKQMLKSKLDKIMNRYGLDDYEDFFTQVERNDASEMWHDFIHEITTHKTDFFRENNHFEFLKKNFSMLVQEIPRIRVKGEVRAWSAGCSTGEEPYTLAMVLRESYPEVYLRILATDVSKGALAAGMMGVYPQTIKSEMTPFFLSRYFVLDGVGYRIKEEIKQAVVFRQFNLMDPFPFKKRFDLIFCRNVMIYFSNQVIEILLQKFYDALEPGGWLFIGHSESLINKKHPFRYLQPTVYKK
ncbi:MAG TPA: protein-glutamate O-methyltransferase CheR [Thermotogota bacterium]|mgnify:CR=1 FL=1|nr:protein-glutamate O-methyltransferase CheR [Thermotogota bacterium]HRW91460.1 protein-glutamate O-methyltransferase CheR [Thermotogota bacterium]